MKKLSLIAAASALVLAGCAQQPVSQPGTPEPVPVLSAEIAPGVTVHYERTFSAAGSVRGVWSTVTPCWPSAAIRI